MKLNQPFLHLFPTQLQGRAPDSPLHKAEKAIESLREKSISCLQNMFSFVLPIERVMGLSLSERCRLYPDYITFWAWAAQLLAGNKCCQRAVTLVQSWHQSNGTEPPGKGTKAYCNARMRIKDKFLDSLHGCILSFGRTRERAGRLWNGFRLKAIDATSVKLMDTKANQEKHPQPSGQKPGCGFPVMGVVAVLDLATGMFVKALPVQKKRHDAKGLYKLLRYFRRGDVVLADRAYCSYVLIALLLQRGAHCIMRLHQRRDAKKLWKQGKRLGKDSRLVSLGKPAKRSRCGVTKGQWRRLPGELQLRLVRIRAKGRDGKKKTMYVVASLLDHKTYPCQDICEAYAQRWKIEVKFRDIKTTLGLEMFNVKTPAMAYKTLKVLVISYNLVKALQLEAIYNSDIRIDEISLKGTVDVIMEYRFEYRGLGNRPRLLKEAHLRLLDHVSDCLFIIRPGRSEPRAIKARPKPHQYLTEDRSVFKEIMHRSKYRKAA